MNDSQRMAGKGGVWEVSLRGGQGSVMVCRPACSRGMLQGEGCGHQQT
jgi:hypothetical protein